MAKKVPSKWPLVEVEWADACTYSSDFEIEKAVNVEFAVRVTVGYLLREDEERTVIAGTIDLPDKCADVTILPTGWILDVRRKRNAGRRRPANKEGEDSGS